MPDPASPPNGEKKEPVIYTIPDQFYGTAAKADLPRENAVIAPKPPLPPPPPAIRPSAPAAKPSGPLKPASKKWLIIPILAVILIVAMGLVAWIYVRSLSKPAPVTPVVTLPEPEPEPVPEPVPEPATTTPETPPDHDLDHDGLINEEEALYGASATNTDSDADGYDDALEVVNLYNPAGFKPIKLLEAGSVKTFEGAMEGSGPEISFLYPAAAEVRGNTDERPGNFGVWWSVGPEIQPGVRETQYVTIETFSASGVAEVGARVPDLPPEQLQSFVTKSGLTGMRTPEGTPEPQAAITVDGRTFLFRLRTLNGSPARHEKTFTMLLHSFSKKP